jgi:hypothetical protein
MHASRCNACLSRKVILGGECATAAAASFRSAIGDGGRALVWLIHSAGEAPVTAEVFVSDAEPCRLRGGDGGRPTFFFGAPTPACVHRQAPFGAHACVALWQSQCATDRRL